MYLLIGASAGILGLGLWAVIIGWPYVFGSGNYLDILVATDTDRGDEFGSSVAISDEWLAVGAFRDSDIVDHAGAAYVARRQGTTVDQFERLALPDLQPGDQAGFSIALDGQWLAVGRIGQFGQQAAATKTEGRVDLFELQSAGWTYRRTLTLPDSARDDRFGFSAAISGDWLAVGARGVGGNAGAVALYRLSALQSSQSGTAPTQILRAEKPESGDRFGESIALVGRNLVIGAPGSAVSSESGRMGKEAGLVHLFELPGPGGSWQRDGGPLQASVPEAGAQFGTSVATDGAHVLIGASHWRAGVREGSVWASSRESAAGQWPSAVKIPVPDSQLGDMDGFRVTIDGPNAIASAHLSDARGLDSGTVILFTRTDNGWQYKKRLAPEDGNREDHYGIALAIDKDTFLVGAGMADARGRKSGGVYLQSLL